MVYFLLGSTGFIGNLLASELRARSFPVHTWTRSDNISLEEFFQEADIKIDSAQLEVSAIFINCVGRIPKYINESSPEFLESNLYFVYEIARYFPSRSNFQFIHLSTTSLNDVGPSAEVLNDYLHSKKAAEDFCASLNKRLDVRVLRIPTIVSDSGHNSKVLNEIFQHYDKDFQLKIESEGKTLRLSTPGFLADDILELSRRVRGVPVIESRHLSFSLSQLQVAMKAVYNGGLLIPEPSESVEFEINDYFSKLFSAKT